MQLRCGCTNGIRVRLDKGNEWLVCPTHDDPQFVAHVRRQQKAEWFRVFTPNTKGRREQVPYV